MKLSYKTLVFVFSFLVLGSSIALAFCSNEKQSVYRSSNADFGEELLVPGWEYGDLVARNGADYVLAVNDSHQLIGVVSATTAFIGNAVPDPTPDHAVVGYLGIVLTNVSTENGTIAAGDPVGASSQPGIGMKMTSSGYIVGRALGDFTTGTTCGAYQCGQVEVQVIPSWFDPYILAAGGTTSYMASLNGLADSDQLFATATSGTDFSINSVSGTHTFSIPDASTSARGLLTSSDWTTFNNKLSNIFTTKGDLLTFSTTPERLGVGTDGQVLTADSTTPTGLKWGTPAAGGTGTVTSVGFATGTTGTDVNVSGSPITTSGTITINIPDASTTARGLVTTGAQTFAGVKTFSGNTSFTNNVQQTGAKTLSTGTGAVSLNGATSVTGTNTFTVGTGTTTLGGTLLSNGNATLGDASTDTLTVNSVLQNAIPLVFEGAMSDPNETSFAITDPSTDQTITFPDATGTVLLDTALSTTAFIQNGNSFGVAAVLGTNDANSLSFETNGITQFTIPSGVATLNGSGATTVAGGTTLTLSSGPASTLTVDSGTTGSVNIGTGASAKAINIGGAGANTIALGNTQTGGSISIGNAMTTGSVSIGGTGAQTGTISLGVGTGSQTVNLATGNATKNINIGTGTAGNIINIATSNTTADTIAIGSALDTLSATSANWGVTSAGLVSGGTAGTAASPTYTFTGDADTGFFRSAANTLGFSTNGTQRMSISSTGVLDVAGTVTMNGLSAVAAAGPKVVCYNTTTGELLKSGSASSCSTSSRRFKHDITDLPLGLSFVDALRPVSFTYNGTNEKSLGFVAEEVAALDPRLIYTDNKGVVTGVEYERFIPILTKAVQELSTRFDTLKGDIASWLGEKDNGIERVQVQELCVGDTCIDEETLQQVLKEIQ